MNRVSTPIERAADWLAAYASVVCLFPAVSEIPGPGAYNPVDQRELELAAKKGAMLEKTDRFKEGQKQPGKSTVTFRPGRRSTTAISQPQHRSLRVLTLAAVPHFPDTFGLYDVASKENKALQPRTATKLSLARPSGEDIKLRLQVAQLEKDLKRATNKVARLEQSRVEANTEKQDQAKEISSLKAELRQ